jgi:(E)-4-hydroxy-3-methylbut-2-enyl-diphosphate synthase
MGINVPIVGDFHYIGTSVCGSPGLCRGARQYHQPGNAGSRKKRTAVRRHCRDAIKHGKPVRIGANWGSSTSSC